MTKSIVEIRPDADALAASAADFIVRAAREAIAQRGRFTFVLAGGLTPEKAYLLLAHRDRAGTLDWSRTAVFLGDERFVVPTEASSNLGMVRRSLLANLPVAPVQVFPETTTAAGVAEAAGQYADELARFFGTSQQKTPPRFDLVLLGLGDDGHTASLFPGKPAVREEEKWVTWSPPGVLPPPVDRITFTFPLLNAAREVLFLVAGAKKAGILKEVLEIDPPRDRYPAAGVKPAYGSVTWLVDAAAASRLSRKVS